MAGAREEGGVARTEDSGVLRVVSDRGRPSSHRDSPGLACSENDGGGGVASGEGERSNWHRKGEIGEQLSLLCTPEGLWRCEGE